MPSTPRQREALLLIALLTGVAGIVLWVVPASVEDPEGFGYAQGLPPSFTVYLVALLAGAVMLVRLLRLWLTPALAVVEVEAAGRRIGAQALSVIGACLLFAFLLIPGLGFYPSSLLFIVAASLILGERRPIFLTAPPVAVTGGLFLAFEYGFNIFLPRGHWIEPLMADLAG